MAQNVLKNNRLINFSTFQCSSQQQRNCHRQAYNSLMLKMSQLDRYEQAEDFTQCEKEQCKMVLTNQDKEYIDDWNWVQSNEELYSDVKDKIEKMKTNKWGYYIWNCRFCGTKNLIEKNNAHFAKNRSKVVIKQAVQGQRINRVSDNPLILFVIDNSTSMQQQLPTITQILQKQNKDQESNEKQLSNMINQKLKKTQIYKKIVENDKKQLNQIRKKIDVENKSQIYTDNITKYKILMSMTENVISSICNNGKYNTNSMKMSISNQLERKIGFMFFNSDIVLQKIPRITDTKVIKISNKEYMADQGTNDHLKVDFHNFKQLFQAGFNNSQDYGMDMTNFKFSDIFFNHSSPTGQSALGPALVVASGIISGYGSGSLIVVITDGKANKGIFGQGGLYSQQLAMLKFKIHKARAQTCLIKLQQKQSSDNAQNQQILQRYFRKNSSIISISLDEKQPLDELQRRLKSIIDKAITSKTWTNNIRIKCQNPNIRYNQKQIQRMKKKLFKQNQIQFISPQINQQKLTVFDYQHPFITQIIIEYQNIETKQQSKFMAYIVQKILKYGQFNKKEEEQFHSSQTLNNVISYLHSEGEKFDLQKIPLTLAKESFRSFVMESFRHSVQQEFSRETMADMTDFIHKPIFKTPKDYIRSLVQKNQPYKHHEDQNNEEQYQTL